MAGLQPTAIQGQFLIKKLIQQADNRIIIMPGSGLNSKNSYDFLIETKAIEIHASAKKVIPPECNSLFSMAYFETDVGEVRKIIDKLKQADFSTKSE